MRFVVLAGAIMFWGLRAAADPVQFDEGIGEVDVFGAPVELPWRLRAAAHPNVSGALQIFGEAEIAPLLEVLEAGLVAELNAKSDACETRVAAAEPLVEINAEGRLVVAVTVHYQRWLCRKMLGRWLKTKLASETGRLRAEIEPEVVSGRVQMRLQAFGIAGLRDLSRLLDVEGSVRDDIMRAMDDFNRDLLVTALPHEVALEGFAYQQVALVPAPSARLTATIAGPDSALAILRIIKALEAK